MGVKLRGVLRRSSATGKDGVGKITRRREVFSRSKSKTQMPKSQNNIQTNHGGTEDTEFQ
jgi:hypothetical protein